MSADQEETYPLPSEMMSSLAWNHHLDDLVNVRSICEDFGIQTSNTRLDRYEKFLRKYLDGDQIGGESVFQMPSSAPFQNWMECLQYVLREVHELMWILKGIQANQPKGVKEKLDWIIGGRDFAFLDVDSRSRDAQFELRIASYFSQAGFAVDLTSKTDVIVHSDNHVYYIECKRVGSTNKFSVLDLSNWRRLLTSASPEDRLPHSSID